MTLYDRLHQPTDQCWRQPQKYILPCFWILTTYLLLNCTLVQAQTAVVKVNLAGFLQGTLGGAVEIKLSEQFTTAASIAMVSHTTGDEADTSTVYSKESGFLVSPEARYYFGGLDADAPTGFFVGADVLYESAKLTYKSTPDTLGNILTTTGNASNIGLGIILGSQWIFSDRFAVELFFNPYYNFPKTSGDIATNPESNAFIRNYEDEKSGFILKRIGLSIGIAF